MGDAGPTRIAVLGADGRMGRALVRAIAAVAPQGKLSAAVERDGNPSLGQDAGVLAGSGAAGVPVQAGLPGAGAADVWIDFTIPAATVAVAEAAFAAGAALVIGTTGLG